MNALERSDIFFAAARSPSPIVGAIPAPRGKDGKINPHVTRFLLRDHRVSDLFHVKPIYYETREGFWRPLSEVASYHGNRRIVIKPEAMLRCSMRFLRWLIKRQAMIGGVLEFGYPGTFYWGVRPRDLFSALSLTAFPDPDPEVTSVDGIIFKEAGSWAAARDAAVGDTANSSAGFLNIAATYSAAKYIVRRAFVLFDTSSIGDSDTVTDATFALYVTGVTDDDDDGDDYLAFVSSSPATNTNLITADFNDVGSTEYGDSPDLGALTTGAYNTITLNAAGLAAIDKAGISKFALREGHDFENSAPVAQNSVAASSADFAGTSQDPKLTVTYTAAGATDIGGAFFF